VVVEVVVIEQKLLGVKLAPAVSTVKRMNVRRMKQPCNAFKDDIIMIGQQQLWWWCWY